MSVREGVEVLHSGGSPRRAGAIAGAVVGVLWGISEAVGGLIIYHGFGVILQSVKLAGYSIPVAYYMFGESIVGAMILALVGILLVKIERFIPGHKTTLKGAEVMLLFWFVSRGLATILGYLSIALLLWTLLTYASAGVGLGYLVNRFSKRSGEYGLI